VVQLEVIITDPYLFAWHFSAKFAPILFGNSTFRACVSGFIALVLKKISTGIKG
jgi:hypothetical protein